MHIICKIPYFYITLLAFTYTMRIKQCASQKFCNTVLHNEACDAHKELHRHKAKEITFSDLTLEEARQLHTFDEYFKGEIAFERAGKKITPKLLLEAIRTLPEEKRKAVLLYYFEGMNDTEIAELFNTSRSTIQYRRTSSFEKLRKYLEENADEWDECYRILKPTGAFYCWGSSQMIDKLSVSLKVSRLYAKS